MHCTDPPYWLMNNVNDVSKTCKSSNPLFVVGSKQLLSVAIYSKLYNKDKHKKFNILQITRSPINAFVCNIHAILKS